MSYVFSLLSSAIRNILRMLTIYTTDVVKDIDFQCKIHLLYSFLFFFFDVFLSKLNSMKNFTYHRNFCALTYE